MKCHHTTQQQHTQTPELLLVKHASHRIHATPHTLTHSYSLALAQRQTPPKRAVRPENAFASHSVLLLLCVFLSLILALLHCTRLRIMKFSIGLYTRPTRSTHAGDRIGSVCLCQFKHNNHFIFSFGFVPFFFPYSNFFLNFDLIK